MVGILTPENSGIPQAQINIYLASLPSEDAINEVLTSIQIAIDNSKNNNLDTGTSTESNGHLITSEDIVVQQGIVDQTEDEVIVLQKQLTDIEDQIEQSFLPPTSTPDSDVGSDLPPVPGIIPIVDTTSTPSVTDLNPNATSDPNSANNNNNTNTNTNTDLGNPNTNTDNLNNNNGLPNVDVNNNYDINDNSNNNNYKGIIIQPGPPRLIEGANQY